MAKQDIEGKVREIEALRREPDSEVVAAQLETWLKQRNNYLVAKAAEVAAAVGSTGLLPQIVEAYDRFVKGDPKKSDPQCWAKIALVKAMKELGNRDPEPYIRGLSVVQLGAWVAPPHQRDDAATPLRSACAGALLDCVLPEVELLTYLGDLLTDPYKTVRVDAALAIGRAGSGVGIPLLRLKARSGDEEPEVAGQCFVSLLTLAREEAVGFIREFLNGEDPDARVEAAAALAEASLPEAFEAARRAWEDTVDRDVREAILSGLGGSTLESAAEFLFEVYEEEPGWREKALQALETSRHWRAYAERVRG